MIEIVETKSSSKAYRASKRPVAGRKTKKQATPRIKSRKPVKRKKAWKFKKTELSECDSSFSKEIIERDGHCLYPHCSAITSLTNSHYIGRGNWNTRFDPENCITLCLRHHFMDRNTGFEFQKARKTKEGWDGQYTIFQRNFIGETRFKALLERAEGTKSRKEAILETQRKYSLRQESPTHLLETVDKGFTS